MAWSEPQLANALRAVREHPSSTAQNLSSHIRTAGGHAITPGRATGLLRELERQGKIGRWKRPGTRAWLWKEEAGDA